MSEKALIGILVIILSCLVIVLSVVALNPANGGNTDDSDYDSGENSSIPVVTSSESEDYSTDNTSSDQPSEESLLESGNSQEESFEISDEEREWTYAIDITPYLRYIDPEDHDEFTILVNKASSPLPANYVPKNLVLSPNARPGRQENCYMNATVAKALEAFLKEAAYYGYKDITVTNAYRSYDYQYYLFYDYYFKQEASRNPGKTQEEVLRIVETYCFPPGRSEHQTGLCMDMHNVDVGKQETFNNTPAARWLEENAYRFGFILRYPAGKEHITGAVYESWHFRFVGRTLATYLHDNGLTLDEYYAGNHDAYNK
ncbi:MAG: M15 family metallopeptidase [Eubacteriales bacterium]|jgi:LAS superfamily LD-carboxypeptidase LdcB